MEQPSIFDILTFSEAFDPYVRDEIAMLFVMENP